jgi:hypothetical protein
LEIQPDKSTNLQFFSSPLIQLLSLLTFSNGPQPPAARHTITASHLSPPRAQSPSYESYHRAAVSETAASPSPVDRTQHDTKERLPRHPPSLSVHAPILHHAPRSPRVRPSIDAPITVSLSPPIPTGVDDKHSSVTERESERETTQSGWLPRGRSPPCRRRR